jgi:hypothetical protein
MKKLLLVIAILILVPIQFSIAQDANNVVGVQVGAFVQKGHSPAVAYALGTDISVEEVPLLNKLFSKAETSMLYSDRPQPDDATTEIYGIRVFSVKQYAFYKDVLYGGIGGGAYYLTNTDGGDKTYVAGRIEIGAKIKDMVEVYVGGDIIDVRGGNDLFFPHFSVSFVH